MSEKSPEKGEPQNVRKGLRARADRLTEKIADRLEGALDANGRTWTAVTCKNCFKTYKYEVDVEDWRTIIAAAKELVELGYGRASSDTETATGCLSCSEAREMKDTDIENGMVEWLTQRGFSVNAPKEG